MNSKNSTPDLGYKFRGQSYMLVDSSPGRFFSIRAEWGGREEKKKTPNFYLPLH